MGGCRFTYRFEATAPVGLGWLARHLFAAAAADIPGKLAALPAPMDPT
jgi:hypothetical protein